jgi:hypothetical protein
MREMQHAHDGPETLSHVNVVSAPLRSLDLQAKAIACPPSKAVLADSREC